MNNGLIVSHGTKFWYIDDKLHREDGPAIEFADGSNSWYLNDKFHRLDGPAIEWVNGIKFWYLYGEQVICKDNEEFLRIIKLKAFW